jgi:hypothetical protein
MAKKFTIKCELCDLNTYMNAERRNRFLAAKIKKEETERVAWSARAARLLSLFGDEYPVRIKYRWYSKDMRKDTDNVAFAKKFVNDGLVMAGILENDSRKFVSGFSDEFFVDKENPRVEVEIISVLTT